MSTSSRERAGCPHRIAAAIVAATLLVCVLAVPPPAGEVLLVGRSDIDAPNVGLARYPVIVAWRQDGEELGVRSLGRLRIMFPFDEPAELLTEANRALAVWHLIVMDVR